MSAPARLCSSDPFSRNVHCIFGVPVDPVSMSALVAAVQDAAFLRHRLFLSTPNLNFLMLAQKDFAFRQSLVLSDCCPPDGAGVLLVCRLLGLKGIQRVPGADLPEHLRTSPPRHGPSPLRLAFFGGAPGTGQRACEASNMKGGHLACVGAIDPGMITNSGADPYHVHDINTLGADMLAVALGAEKGQAWLLANRQELDVPVLSHLGATINFMAGAVQRAPRWIQALHLEWLWRIKEEPALARRYWRDGQALLRLIVGQALPLRAWLKRYGAPGPFSTLVGKTREEAAVLHVAGQGSSRDLEIMRETCRNVAAFPNIEIEAKALTGFDLSFAGLLLLLEKQVLEKGGKLQVRFCSAPVARGFELCGLSHLLVR